MVPAPTLGVAIKENEELVEVVRVSRKYAVGSTEGTKLLIKFRSTPQQI